MTKSITETEYWKLMSHHNQKLVGEARLKTTQTEAQLLRQEAKIAQLTFEKFVNTKLRKAEDLRSNVEEEYNIVKKEIETKYEVDMDKYSIDEYSFDLIPDESLVEPSEEN